MNIHITGAICICALLSLSIPCFCGEYSLDNDIQKQDNYYYSVNGGLNLLQKGFPGYANSYCVGADLYIPSKSFGDSWWSSWRVSFDYFPMIVTAGVYGTTEDIFDFSFSSVYYFPRNDAQTSLLFAGIGFGVYGDWIRLDTPATGSRSNITYSPGASVSLGWRKKLKGSLEIVPEIRAHFDYVARDYFTMNTSIGLGILWRFDKE